MHTRMHAHTHTHTSKLATFRKISEASVVQAAKWHPQHTAMYVHVQGVHTIHLKIHFHTKLSKNKEGTTKID